MPASDTYSCYVWYHVRLLTLFVNGVCLHAPRFGGQWFHNVHVKIKAVDTTYEEARFASKDWMRGVERGTVAVWRQLATVAVLLLLQLLL